MMGPEQGICEICCKPGQRQQSITDPMSPSLKILCKEHRREFKCGNPCIICGQTPTYETAPRAFYCHNCAPSY